MEPPRLVIIDDDPRLSRVIASVARESFPRESDLRVEVHEGPEPARNALAPLVGRSERVVVVSDHHLPPSRTTGLDLLREIGGLLPHAKRVLMTGSEREELEPALSAASLDAFLPKPFTWLEVEPLLRRLVAESSPPALPGAGAEDAGGGRFGR